MSKYISYTHAVLAFLLGAFFINAGVKKFSKQKINNETQNISLLKIVDNEDLDKDILIDFIKEKNYKKNAPLGYNITMKTFKESGFLNMIAIFQLLAGLLILFPKTRFVGLCFLLPIIFNIFFMHIYFDDRMDENIKCGILLLVNLLLILYYYKNIFRLFNTSKDE